MVTVVTVLERSLASAMLKPSTWPSDHAPTARRVASPSRLWRRKAFSRPSSCNRSIAWRSANNRCTGAAPVALEDLDLGAHQLCRMAPADREASALQHQHLVAA